MIKENCFGCGCKIDSKDYYDDSEIIFKDGHYWCEDCDENPTYFDENDIPEDTPCLDEPWWTQR